MLNNLVLNNFQSGWDTTHIECDGNFIMKTCQRTLVLSFGKNPCIGEENSERLHLSGQDAYSYLLEVICGLKSQLVGENEIVGQFKTAYKAYTAQEDINTSLLLIIEKLFRDAKTIRSKYLLGLSQKTYASIARKQIVRHRNAEEVLILGSGQLAEDLINQFKKKAKVFVCARNKERVQELVREHNIESIDWIDLEEVSNFAFIVNSIGFDGTLFDNDFFEAWTEKFENNLFIDLGSPSILETEFGMEEGVMHLQDIFKEGAIHESRKKQQIKKARVAMEGIAARRHKLLETKLQSKILNTPANKTKIAYV